MATLHPVRYARIVLRHTQPSAEMRREQDVALVFGAYAVALQADTAFLGSLVAAIQKQPPGSLDFLMEDGHPFLIGSPEVIEALATQFPERLTVFPHGDEDTGNSGEPEKNFREVR